MKKLFYFLIFSASLHASAQLLNPDFEYWASSTEDPLNTNYAVGWTCTNGIPLWVAPPFHFPAPTDSQSGNHALRLCVFNHDDKDMAYQVSSINSRPVALNGFYKYTLNQVTDVSGGALVEDFASVTVYLTKDNVTIGSGTLTLSGIDSYTLFSCPITYTSNQIPDIIRVNLNCSILTKNWEDGSTSHTSNNPDGISSVFTVDNLQLIHTLSDETFSLNNVKIYPNPASDKIFISNFEGTVTIYNTLGKRVLTEGYTHAGIDVEALQSGIYTVHLNYGGATNTIKFIKE